MTIAWCAAVFPTGCAHAGTDISELYGVLIACRWEFRSRSRTSQIQMVPIIHFPGKTLDLP